MGGGSNVACNVSASPSLSVSESEFNSAPARAPACEESRTFSADESRVANLAVELGCDFSWGTWSSRQFTLGISPAVLEAALHEAVNCGKLSQPYVGKIAARYKLDGIPKVASNGKPKVKLHEPSVTNMPVNAQNLPDGLEQLLPESERLEKLLEAREKGLAHERRSKV